MTEDAVTTWRAHPADAALVAPLFDAYRGFYGKPSDVALAIAFVRERLGRDESVIFVASPRESEEREAVGFVQLYPTWSSVRARPALVLNDLYVEPAWRGRRVGHALLEAARAFAVDRDAAQLVLATAADNLGAQRLYESLGYVRDPFFHYELDL